MFNTTRTLRTAIGALAIAVAIVSPSALHAQKADPAPNYDLAAQWTSQKVAKLCSTPA